LLFKTEGRKEGGRERREKGRKKGIHVTFSFREPEWD
jgi:hypothetical protein